MLKAIVDFFDLNMKFGDDSSAGQVPDQELRLATAALLLEMTRADFQVGEAEQMAVSAAVQSHFGLDAEKTSALILLAETERSESTDYFQFTSLINRHYSLELKVQLIELLWRIAYADDKLHMYEEHLVRRIADLLHVPHGAFMAAKHRASTPGKDIPPGTNTEHSGSR